MNLSRAFLLGLAMIVLAAGQQVSSGARQRNEKSKDYVLEVKPSVIAPGESAVLYWSIKGATKVVIEEVSVSSRELRKIGTFGGTGQLEVRPREDTTYVMSCEGSTTLKCASVNLRVDVKRH